MAAVMRRAGRTHQLTDDGITDARATEVKTFRRDILMQTGMRTFQNDTTPERQPRAASDTPRRRPEGDEELPVSARSARTPKVEKETSNPEFHIVADSAGDLAPTFPGLDKAAAAPASTTRSDTPLQLTLRQQSSNLSNNSGPEGSGQQDSGHFHFEPILESLAERSRVGSLPKPQSMTVNSLASSRAADFDEQSSKSLGLQHQLAWLYKITAGETESSTRSSKHHAAGTVNSLASSNALDVGDPGRFRRTETLLMSNERRQREMDAELLAELKKEHSAKSNTIESLVSSWPESLATPPLDPGSPSQASPQAPPLGLPPPMGRSPEPSDSRPSSRGSQGRADLPRHQRAAKKSNALSMASLEDIEEELDDDPSISWGLKKLSERNVNREESVKSVKSGEASRERGRRQMGSISPKAYESDPSHIASFQ